MAEAVTETPVTWPVSSLPHGTNAGYQKCKRRPAGPCQPCSDAAADYMRSLRIETRQTKCTNVPNDLLAELLEQADDATRRRAAELFGANSVRALAKLRRHLKATA